MAAAAAAAAAAEVVIVMVFLGGCNRPWASRFDMIFSIERSLQVATSKHPSKILLAFRGIAVEEAASEKNGVWTLSLECIGSFERLSEQVSANNVPDY